MSISISAAYIGQSYIRLCFVVSIRPTPNGGKAAPRLTGGSSDARNGTLFASGRRRWRRRAMEGLEDLLTEVDDDFHPVTSHQWFWHETCFFYFYVPERKTGCWLYNYIRPNIGVSGGGCWVWDERTHFHMEAPYYANYSALELPKARNLRDFRFPSGVHVRMLEPLS